MTASSKTPLKFKIVSFERAEQIALITKLMVFACHNRECS